MILLWVFTSLPLFTSVYHEVEQFVFKNLMPTHSKEVMAYINTFMENSHKLGWVGLGYVTFAAVMFFKNYDYIVNDIFDTPNRTIWEAFRTYSLLMLSLPLMMGISFYLSAILQSYLSHSSMSGLLQLFYFLPFVMVWMVFYILYRYSANTPVTLQAASLSSFITALVWYLSKSAFIFYVIHNKTYSSIYGSIATLLFFFLWIYISWVIFLHGLKFCDLLNREEEIDHI